LDETASDMAEKVLKETGVKVITCQTVTEILGKKDKSTEVGGVLLSDNTKISCDLVVIAIGVIPRIDLVKQTPLKVNRGIIVDRYMRTNLPDVYACGDVSEAYDFLVNSNRLLPLWPLAHLGGRVAGYNMAGKPTKYDGGTVMSSLNYFNLPIIAVGTVNPKNVKDYEVLVEFKPEKKVYKKIVLKDGSIQGFILLGDLEKAGIFYRLLQKHVDLNSITDRLLSDDFGIITLPEQYREEIFMVN
jgi:NAD(P)H-nitrite reductase large subunit